MVDVLSPTGYSNILYHYSMLVEYERRRAALVIELTNTIKKGT